MRRLVKIFLIVLSTVIVLNVFAFENLVYTWRGFPDRLSEGKIAIADFKVHATEIDILSSEAYHIDEHGVVYGSMHPEMIRIAKVHHVKLLPLVGNKDFDRARTHVFLNDRNAETRAIQSILQICKDNHYDGVQIDFEGMSVTDRDAFTNFYHKVAQALRQNNLIVAIAIIPTLTTVPLTDDYLQRRYKNWSGVYNYKALATDSDFITLMTYDQHGDITPPGPLSGKIWCEEIIKYALKYIPANKISLGIPWHSAYWYTGTNPYDADDHSSATPAVANLIWSVSIDLSYPDMQKILKENHATLRWEPEDQIPYTFFRKDFLYQYIFVEDVQSLKAKLALVKKYNLRGISSWVLGEEDPKIWQEIKERNASVLRPTHQQ